MDDDLCGVGHVEVCVVERLLPERMSAVHVPPGEQQILDLHLLPVLSKLSPGCVVQVNTLDVFLHTCGDIVS